MKPISPKEYAKKYQCNVIVFSNGYGYIDYESTLVLIPEGVLEITEEDLDNIYYPDGTSMFERMARK